MKVYDSRLKQKIDFVPIKEKKVRIYVCGPTVYDDAHLGHARSAIVFDILRRVFVLSGYEVIFVKNFTDIDDKIIKKSIQTKIPIQELTQHYMASYLHDMASLKVKEPDIAPEATKSIAEITTLIQKLIDKGFAYTFENGDIYLNVQKDDKYGSISGRGIDDENIARIQNDEHKKDSRDFVLWKAYKGADDIGYESALGKGRPGWHIECSAMIEEYLAYKDTEFSIDIHAGGADLLFPHHENEASQTRCATDREIAKYWMHNGFVNINGEKMSKSLGNSFFIKDALKAYSGEILRNYLLGVHYRAILHFNEQDLIASKKRLDKIYRLKKRVGKSTESKAESNTESHAKSYADESFKNAMLEAMSDDLNISKALSILEEMLNSANAKLDSAPKDKQLKNQIIDNIKFVEELLGIGGGDEVLYFQHGVSDEQKQYIQNLINKRLEAKKNKDFALADSIREELYTQGIALSDTIDGCIWEKVE